MTTARLALAHSALLLAQEYVYTEFDWRVGVLNREPLYACKYYMSRGHWQIYNHGAKGTAKSGGFETIAVSEAPAEVIKLALKATQPIGDGLYGVDLKQVGKAWGMPTTVLVDGAGCEIGTLAGPAEWASEDALKLVLSSRDTITGLQGLAGAGKTTTLRELHAAVRQSGRALIVCAPSAAATDVLRKEGFAEAVTVAKLLTSDAPLPARSVLVVDEAGTLGSADMLRVFVAARDARVVLVGDTGQHAPVAQGDALRIIEQHSGFRFGQLTEIRRQRSDELKETVALAAKQRTGEAFSRLLKAGEVVEHGDTAALHRVQRLPDRHRERAVSAALDQEIRVDEPVERPDRLDGGPEGVDGLGRAVRLELVRRDTSEQSDLL